MALIMVTEIRKNDGMVICTLVLLFNYTSSKNIYIFKQLSKLNIILRSICTIDNFVTCKIKVNIYPCEI